MSKKSQQLDLWATALGVTNDDDALKVLRKVVIRLKAGMDSCDEIAKATAGAPDDTVKANANRAKSNFEKTLVTALAVTNAFKQHSRGQG